MKKYCNRCNRYHDSPPVDEKKIIQDHADAIAREIDKEVMDTLRWNKVVKSGSIRVGKKP